MMFGGSNPLLAILTFARVKKFNIKQLITLNFLKGKIMELKTVKAGTTVYCAEFKKPRNSPQKDFRPWRFFEFECGEKDCTPRQIARQDRYAIEVLKLDLLVRVFDNKEEAEKCLDETVKVDENENEVEQEE